MLRTQLIKRGPRTKGLQRQRAAAAAANAAAAADEKFREQIKAATLEFLDAALPKAVQPTGPLIERAKSLVACASH